MLKKMEDCFGDTIIVKDFKGKGTISFAAEDYETHMRLDKEGLQELIENLTELKEELEKQQNDN